MPDLKLEELHFKYFVEATGYELSEVEHRDKPDYTVVYQNMQTGIELTEGCPEELRRAEAIAKKAELPLFWTSDLPDRSKDSRKPNSELLAKISVPTFDDTELSDIRWAHRIGGRIREKTKKLKAGEIERFQKNWLVVVDTSPNIASNRTEFLRAVLMSALGADFIESPVFDVIYIVGCGNVFIIDERRLHATYRRSTNG